MKIAILHEMLIKLWGAEKVVEELTYIFPDASLYTLIYDEIKVWKIFPRKKIHPSCFSLPSQKRYNLIKRQKLCLPKMTESVELLDFSNYDVLIISSSGFAHGALTKPHTKTIVYYHAPARYLWDWTHEYRRELWFHKWVLGYIFGTYLKKLRQWDYIASRRPDIVLVNSNTTQSRIWKYYRRESQVIFPPIDIKRFQKTVWVSREGKKYYIILSALTEFKRLDVAIKNFSELSDIPLVIIGEWSQRKELESLVGWSKNIMFTGAKYGDELVVLVQNSLGLIFPGEEDFGIVPIEVMAAWKPVFALRKGWLTETILEWISWEFFDDPGGKDFQEKFIAFHTKNISNKYNQEACQKQASLYDKDVFRKKILEQVFPS